MQTKDYTNALLSFNSLVYNELMFKTREDFSNVINIFTKEGTFDIEKISLNLRINNKTYSPTQVVDTIIDKEHLTLIFVTNWAPHVEMVEIIANTCKEPVYYKYRTESMVTDHVGEYLFKDNQKEGYRQECSFYNKEMPKDSLAIALYFKVHLAEDLSFTEINKDYVKISYDGDGDKSALDFNHTTTLMKKFNSL